MARHFATPADHWRGVRGPVVITVVLLVLSPFALFAVRAQHQRRAAEYERAIMIREASQPRPQAPPPVWNPSPGRE